MALSCSYSRGEGVAGVAGVLPEISDICMPWKIKWSPALNANTETPDDSRSITGITKLNNFEFSSAESITCWRAYCIDRGQVENQLNRKSLLHIVI